MGRHARADRRVRRRSIRPLERDLEQVLGELSEEFPLLASLVERKAGGQKHLPLGPRGKNWEGQAFVTASVSTQTDQSGDTPAEPPLPQEPECPPQQDHETSGPRPTLPGGMPARGKPLRSRLMRYGLELRVESHPGDPELGRLIKSAVVINQAHPAYRRAVASRSEGYHIALCVALAMARLAAEPKESQTFVTTFMTRWGEALEGPPSTYTTAAVALWPYNVRQHPSPMSGSIINTMPEHHSKRADAETLSIGPSRFLSDGVGKALTPQITSGRLPSESAACFVSSEEGA